MQTISTYLSLSYSKWDCKYHVVFVPKYRKKILYGKIRSFSAPIFHELASTSIVKSFRGSYGSRSCAYDKSIPPKYAILEVIGYIKGKGAMAVARQFGGRRRNFNGEKFWDRGYAVSTVGFEVERVKSYV